MAVDSEACENVIDAEEMVPGFEIKQTKASMSGVSTLQPLEKRF